LIYKLDSDDVIVLELW